MRKNREIWKEIKWSLGFYSASNFGRIRSNDRIVRGKNGSSVERKGQIIKPQTTSKGYLAVVLSLNGKKKACKVHRLIASTFIDSGHKGFQVNHIDCDKKNNRVENLEYVTCKENIRHAIRNGRYDHFWGKNHHMTKLVKEDFKQIRKLFETGKYFDREIAEMFGVHKSTIWKIRHNKGSYERKK